jgi:precorrin-6A/cobalt-precorrin-6A reductase
MRILILGGTGEAIALANALSERRHKVTTALAGRTGSPHKPAGELRIGGFGGADGLAEFTRKGRYEYLVDATHPFAAQISANAVEAAKAADIPLLRIDRPAWLEPEKADWVHVADEAAAAEALPGSATVLLTIGRQRLEPFLERTDCRFILRCIEAPDIALPPNFSLRVARPPFDRHAELALMRQHNVSHLVTKNAGGVQTQAKLDAAFYLKVKVIMIDRPALPDAETVASVAEALAVFDQLPAPSRLFGFLP